MNRAWLEEAGIDIRGRRGDPHSIYFTDPDDHRYHYYL